MSGMPFSVSVGSAAAVLPVPESAHIAKTPSFSKVFRFSLVLSGLLALSRRRTLILRPFTPPAAFTFSKYASAAWLSGFIRTAMAPERSTSWPIRISLSVTPGVAACAANASAKAATTAAVAGFPKLISLLQGECDGLLFGCEQLLQRGGVFCVVEFAACRQHFLHLIAHHGGDQLLRLARRPAFADQRV